MIDVSTAGDCAAFEVEGLHKKLIIEVDDPAGTVAKLRGALRRSASPGLR